MSRVIIFSRYFPSYHPLYGEPTYFVEKIIKGLPHVTSLHPAIFTGKFGYNCNLLSDRKITPKYHTVRTGNRWKVGDKFSPRVWSGKPYRSKQIIIAPDIEVKKVWKIELEEIIEQENGTGVTCTIDGKLQNIPVALPKNDGLRTSDFVDWFNLKTWEPFEGQIICWNKNIDY